MNDLKTEARLKLCFDIVWAIGIGALVCYAWVQWPHMDESLPPDEILARLVTVALNATIFAIVRWRFYQDRNIRAFFIALCTAAYLVIAAMAVLQIIGQTLHIIALVIYVVLMAPNVFRTLRRTK